MTVSVVSAKKIKVTLTHTEVIACFGEYESLINLTPKTKICLILLLNDIISKHLPFLKANEISAKISLIKNRGCIITLSAPLYKTECTEAECLFEFSNSDALTNGITELYKNKSNHKFLSQLYETDKGYCLIVRCKNPTEKLFLLHEFCPKISEDARDIEYVREYGKPLILNSAIKRYGKAFLKPLH